MRYYRRARENNTLSVILLLIILWFVGSNLGPTSLARVAPWFYQAQTCAWVRTSENRANHQSLIGRGTSNPLRLSVTTTPVNRADPAGSMFVRILVTNTTLGTVPFVYDANQVIVGDNGSSGLGVIFFPASSLSAGLGRVDPPIFPDAQVKLLGPRQSCIHTIEFPNGNVLIDPAISSGTAQVRAFYRGATAGGIVAPQQPIYPNGLIPTPIFRDAGLWVGYTESPPVVIPLAPSA
jgi:hypothetical protein